MRPEKESMLAELKQVADESVFLLFTDVAGMNTKDTAEMRGIARENEANVRVIKNRMFRHVAKDMGLDGEMNEHLTGSTGLVYGKGEVSTVAKALKKFIDENKIATFKMGAVEGAFVTKEQIEQLAKLPSRQELLSMMLGGILAPAQNIANLLNNSMGELAGLFAAYEDKLKEEA